jgi:lipopolysaccharide heptosyltransferase II
MTLRADLLKAVDPVLGRALAAVLGRLPRRGRGVDETGPSPARVLVIRPGGIGDAVLFIPMLQALRRAWPGSEIHLLLERRNRGVLEGTALVDRIHVYDDLRPARFGLLAALRQRFDVVIDTEQVHYMSAIVAWMTGAPRRIGFATNGRRRLLTEGVAYDEVVYEVYSFLDLAARATGREAQWNPEEPFYAVPAGALTRAREWLAPLEDAPRVVIHPGASIPERRWPPERYAELALMLAREGAGIVVLGGPGDGPAASVIAGVLSHHRHVNLATRCRLAEAAAVVSLSDVYVSADSGVLHLACAVGTPTVHLFGPGVHSKWGPQGQKFLPVRTDAPCSPCTRYGYTPPCNQGLICMLRITAAEVARAVRSQLEQRRAS